MLQTPHDVLQLEEGKAYIFKVDGSHPIIYTGPGFSQRA